MNKPRWTTETRFPCPDEAGDSSAPFATHIRNPKWRGCRAAAPWPNGRRHDPPRAHQTNGPRRWDRHSLLRGAFPYALPPKTEAAWWHSPEPRQSIYRTEANHVG